LKYEVRSAKKENRIPKLRGEKRLLELVLRRQIVPLPLGPGENGSKKLETKIEI